jgi:hypothetical protein
MSDGPNDVPEGFAPLADPESDAPELTIIQAERWRKGVVVVYRGLREWTSAKGDLHRAHAIQGDGDDGRFLYGVWGTAVLDRLFQQVSIGERVFLRYDGLEPHPTLSSKSIHKWTVARARAAAPVGSSNKASTLPFGQK